MGPFDYDLKNGSRPILSLRIKRYDHAEIYAFNKSYYFSPNLIIGTTGVCTCDSVCTCDGAWLCKWQLKFT